MQIDKTVGISVIYHPNPVKIANMVTNKTVSPEPNLPQMRVGKDKPPV